MTRPFRFALTIGDARDRATLVEMARQAEEAGFDVLAAVDHIGSPLGALPLLTAAAEVSTLRISPMVLANDYRNPVVMAQDAATIDILSEGRFELGIGTGWIKAQYDSAGIPFDPPANRVDRLAEALQVIKGVWTDQHYRFEGEHYRAALEGSPMPVQKPHPPILLGGAGRRLLQLAAREADIVGISVTRGLSSFATFGRAVATSGDRISQQLDWIRSAAGDRFEKLELSTMVHGFAPGASAREEARRIAAEEGVDESQALASPHLLVGPPDYIADTLIERRERYGISYIVFRGAQLTGAAEVVRRLAGA